ncbi:aminotransferase class I/II-fold pyridoxal phosphate-dependent enzyme [Lentzea sp. NPDC058450]|uniref:aminotransferase class I/II-fold pyridoxal phosphate-dependent enzyme n=1 Tax=Lentzea sp. NPDC058450 TaxID=3346505 RepID=UPI0036606058
MLDGLRHALSTLPAEAVKVIVTDGVFSMEGDEAPLRNLLGLAEENGTLLVVDDSHGTGVAGPRGRGTAESHQVLGGVDVITGTLGKALGGAIGGFVAGSGALTSALRTLSRPYTFSNNPPPAVVAGARAALNVLAGPDSPLPLLRTRVARLRAGITALGLPTFAGDHPVVPVVVGDELETRALSERMIAQGVFTTALTYPVVPRGQARLRLQVSAAHSESTIDHVLDALASCWIR